MVTYKVARWRRSWRVPVACGFFLALFAFVHVRTSAILGDWRFFWPAALLGVAAGVMAASASGLSRADRVPGIIVIGLHLTILLGGAIELSRHVR